MLNDKVKRLKDRIIKQRDSKTDDEYIDEAQTRMMNNKVKRLKDRC